MNLSWNGGALLLAGTLAMTGSNAVAQQITGSFERTLEVDEPLELDVVAGSGSISVRDGRRNEVQIVGRIVAWPSRGRGAAEAEESVRRLEANPPIELTGNILRVGYIEDWDDHVSISYEIEVPADTRVMSRTGSGSQTLSGVRGPIEASAGSGSLTLTDLGGAVEASTGSGSIRADGIAGAFQARAGSGSIRLVQSAPGDVDISTGSGSSEVSGVDGALRVRSGSGSVTVDGRQGGAWYLAAGSGSIRIRLPADAAFDLDADARSGDIYTDHPVTIQSRVARGRLIGEVRGGGPLLQVRTGSGRIRIE